jgi:hypothetical protein
MKNQNADPYNERNRTEGDRSSNDPVRQNADLTDPKRDQERLQPDETTIELPDVKDIPGQEFVNAPPMGMMADTTISSADEEGEGLFNDDEEDDTDIVMGTEGDISRDEKETLRKGDDYMPTRDEDNLHQARMDNVDFEGEELNEKSFGRENSGSDLDIPSEIEDMTVNPTGAEDEENKHYSLGSDDNDDSDNGQAGRS